MDLVTEVRSVWRRSITLADFHRESTMDRRELLGMMGIGAAGLIANTACGAVAGDQDRHEHHEHMKTIGECAMICNGAAHHCLNELKKEKSEHREDHARAHELTM